MNRMLILVLASMFAYSSAFGQEKKPERSQPQKRARNFKQKKDFHLTPSREAAATAFVQEHHPELIQVLKQLRSMHQEQYRNAMAELFTTSERLAELQQRDQNRYELSLEEWKTKSRIELLAAKLSRRSSPKLQKELEALLNKQIDLKIEQQKLEIARLQSRLKRVESSLKRFQNDREKLVQGTVRRLTGSKQKAKAKKPEANSPR